MYTSKDWFEVGMGQKVGKQCPESVRGSRKQVRRGLTGELDRIMPTCDLTFLAGLPNPGGLLWLSGDLLVFETPHFVWFSYFFGLSLGCSDILIFLICASVTTQVLHTLSPPHMYLYGVWNSAFFTGIRVTITCEWRARIENRPSRYRPA